MPVSFIYLRYLSFWKRKNWPQWRFDLFLRSLVLSVHSFFFLHLRFSSFWYCYLLFLLKFSWSKFVSQSKIVEITKLLRKRLNACFEFFDKLYIVHFHFRLHLVFIIFSADLISFFHASRMEFMLICCLGRCLMRIIFGVNLQDANFIQRKSMR